MFSLALEIVRDEDAGEVETEEDDDEDGDGDEENADCKGEPSTGMETVRLGIAGGDRPVLFVYVVLTVGES